VGVSQLADFNKFEQKLLPKCVIVSGGLWEDDAYHLQVLKSAELIICADSGARYVLGLGLMPQIVIGDLDSLPAQDFQELQNCGVEFIKYPQKKDYADTALALQKALEFGYKRIEMVACLGGRFDHTLANVLLLTLPQVREIDIRVIEPSQELFLVKASMKISGQKGDTLSLLPLSPQVSGIRTKGLYYQVPRGSFTMGFSNGVSNVLTEDLVEISVEKGLLLAIHSKKEKSDDFRFLF